MVKILVGSNYFFKDCSGFKSKDEDYVRLIPNLQRTRQIHLTDRCFFDLPLEMTKKQLLELHKECKLGMCLGKFLIPEFNEKFGITIEDLKGLSSLLDRLDDKHLYEKIIYDAYIENNDFSLTDEQRQNAYNEYKKYRQQ